MNTINFKECYERMESINPAILDLTSDEFDRFVKQYNTNAVIFPEYFEDIIENRYDGSRVKFTPVKNPFFEKLEVPTRTDNIVGSLEQMKAEFETKLNEAVNLSSELIQQLQERISSLETSILNLKSTKPENKEKVKVSKKEPVVIEEEKQEEKAEQVNGEKANDAN